LAVNWADEHIPAILQGWYPGAMGGRAIAELLFGEGTPEGKLPVTFYRSTEELPEFTDYSMKNRTYRYMQQEALYPFGYGLSYTEFDFKDLTVNTDVIGSEGIDVAVTVKNAGAFSGRETVQVYVKAELADAPKVQLKSFTKVALQPGETKSVKLHLPADAFGLFDEQGNKKISAGNYLIYVGGSQPDSRSVTLTGKKPLQKELKAINTITLE
jgi:beta-glucosidase